MKYTMYEYANQNFKDFIYNNFNINNSKIKHKLNHTYNVVDNIKYLCGDMNLDYEATESKFYIVN